jgi:hypothetical protein
MARHLLVLEGLAGILATAGRAVAAVADRHAVRGLEAGEVPALHGAGEAVADGDAGDVDELSGHVVRGGDLLADLDHRVGRHAELGELLLRLDLALA